MASEYQVRLLNLLLTQQGKSSTTEKECKTFFSIFLFFCVSFIREQHMSTKALEFTLAKNKESFAKTSILLWGAPKVGKTTLASYFSYDDRLPYFISTEDGQHQLGKRAYVATVSNFEEFAELVKTINDNKKELQSKASCIVLDIARDIADYAGEYILKKHNEKLAKQKQAPIDTLKDAGAHGQGYGIRTDLFIKYVRVLFSTLPVVVIAHATTTTITNEKGEEKEGITRPDLPERIWKWIDAKCDSSAYIQATGKKEAPLAISFVPQPKVKCGSRFKNIVKNYKVDPSNVKATFDAIEADFQKQ